MEMFLSMRTGLRSEVSGCFSRCYAQFALDNRTKLNKGTIHRALCLLRGAEIRQVGFGSSWRYYTSTATTAQCSASLGSSSIKLETLKKNNEGHDSVPQSFDFTAMVACISELEIVWVPARVEEVVQYTCHNLAMRLRTIDRRAWIYLSWHPSLGHIGISEDGPPRPSKNDIYSFGDRVHAVLRGLVMTVGSLSQPWERIASLEFSVRPGETPKYVMHCEIMSRHSNVSLCDYGTGTVLATAHQVGVKMSSVRATRLGQVWLPPPPQSGMEPDCIPDLESFRLLLSSGDLGMAKKGIGNRMVQRFKGISPSLATEMCIASGIEYEKDVEIIEPQHWQNVYEKWSQWLSCLQERRFLCSWSTCGGYSMLGTYPVKEASALTFVRSYYKKFEEKQEFEKIKQRIHRGLKGALVKLNKKIGSLRNQYVDHSAQSALKHEADLLLAHIHLIKPNQETVEVIDWENDKPCVINVDPTKTPSEMVNALYTKAKKQKRAVDQLVPLLEQAEQDQSYLQDVAVLLEQLVGSHEDFEAILDIERELVNEKFLRPSTSGIAEKKSKAKVQKGQKKQSGLSHGVGQSFRTYVSPSGFQVLVGRNSSQNDQLSIRIAQKNDIWMHARGVPGAHVLLRIPAGSTAADEDIQFAADLAAFFSKARLEKKTDVTYASPSFIEKPKGAKPGQVIVKRESVTVGVADRSAAAQSQDEG